MSRGEAAVEKPMRTSLGPNMEAILRGIPCLLPFDDFRVAEVSRQSLSLLIFCMSSVQMAGTLFSGIARQAEVHLVRGLRLSLAMNLTTVVTI